MPTNLVRSSLIAITLSALAAAVSLTSPLHAAGRADETGERQKRAQSYFFDGDYRSAVIVLKNVLKDAPKGRRPFLAPGTAILNLVEGDYLLKGAPTAPDEADCRQPKGDHAKGEGSEISVLGGGLSL